MTHKCRNKAIRLLARRDHSVAELARKLASAHYSESEIEETTEYLTTAGYLDDEKYATKYARARLESMNPGPGKLAFDLARKGFAKPLIEQTVSALFADDDSEMKIALNAAKKIGRSLKSGTDPEKIKRIYYERLLRRGFSMETARDVALNRLEDLAK